MTAPYRYFTIMHGLRGCYMPDSDPYTIRTRTRRELREAIEAEAEAVDSGETIGLSKRAISSLAATVWRDAKRARPASLPFVLPCRESYQSDYCYGIFCGHATRAEYAAQEAEAR